MQGVATLQSARESAGLTRSDLGALIGRTPQTVGRWELGTRTPSPADRFRLAAALGVDVDDLFSPRGAGVVAAARQVADSRTIPDLQRAVALLRAELASLDAPSERGAA